MARAFLRMTLLVATAILVSTLIDSSAMGCLQTDTIDKEQQWACWNFNRGGGYNSRDKCCSGSTCECDESGNYTSNARFGRDCKCSSIPAFVDEYYSRIAEDQQEHNVTQQ